ncbi:MAG: glutathione S-transferase N-terminal domain-containing protein [Chlamydiota bacterium]
MKAFYVLLCCCATVLGYSEEYKPELELFYSPYCYYSQKVLNYLKSIHKSVPLKDVVYDPQAKEELREKGGKMQVPCLLIDAYPLYESDEIIRWFSEHQDCLSKL